MSPLTYAAVTPAKNEAGNLRRLAESLRAQQLRPERWVIVDNGSTDDTLDVAHRLEAELPWVEVVAVPGNATATRGGPVVHAFHAGLEAVGAAGDVVAKLDADVSFEPEFFARLMDEFAADPQLGIAGGTCYELVGGRWVPDHVTRAHVRGATRAYRRACLADVLPLEPRMGWDGIDELKANVRGWRTRSFAHLPFRHHRVLGARESASHKWRAQGDMSHYMGYRLSYLLARALFRARRDPRALLMVSAYLWAVVRRRPVFADDEVRAHLRRQQRLVALPVRIREALGRVDG